MLTLPCTEQLNAARGRLKTILHRGLWEPCRAWLKADCECATKTLHGYLLALMILGVFPTEEVFNGNRADDVQEWLESFNYKPDASACDSCKSKDLVKLLKDVHEKVEETFDGLCIDCMESTKLTTYDEDYFRHNEICCWDSDCRINHGRPTWYYSFCGELPARRSC